VSSDKTREYFEFLAHLGMTKHHGSMEATRELVGLCHIGRGQVVLDVGCGVGATPSYLVETVGCRVIGVDLVGKMIEHSQGRAKADGVADGIEFTVADARRLPFESDLFDAVIMESLNIFFAEKQEAMREYVRVTKPGGYVGITEMTWLKPPLPKVEEFYREVIFAEALDADGWTALLEAAGLEEVVGNGYRIDIPLESKGRFERYGFGEIAKVMLRTVVGFATDRGYRKYLKGGTGTVSRDLLDHVGYGVYAGRKGSSS